MPSFSWIRVAEVNGKGGCHNERTSSWRKCEFGVFECFGLTFCGGRSGGRYSGRQMGGRRGRGTQFRHIQQGTFTHYCWTHGLGGYSSDRCNNPAPGHQWNATFQNKMGGSLFRCPVASSGYNQNYQI